MGGATIGSLNQTKLIYFLDWSRLYCRWTIGCTIDFLCELMSIILLNKPTPKIYRTTNWSSYNQALIKRGNISIWFDPKTQWYAQPQGKHGRNQTYSDTAIQCCLMIKSLFRLSLRMVTGFAQSLIKLCGWAAPNISDIRTPPSVDDKSILILR